MVILRILQGVLADIKDKWFFYRTEREIAKIRANVDAEFVEIRIIDYSGVLNTTSSIKDSNILDQEKKSQILEIVSGITRICQDLDRRLITLVASKRTRIASVKAMKDGRRVAESLDKLDGVASQLMHSATEEDISHTSDVLKKYINVSQKTLTLFRNIFRQDGHLIETQPISKVEHLDGYDFEKISFLALSGYIEVDNGYLNLTKKGSHLLEKRDHVIDDPYEKLRDWLWTQSLTGSRAITIWLISTILAAVITFYFTEWWLIKSDLT